MKKLLTILIFAFLLIPQVSQTADQRCWVKEDCQTFRTNYGATDAIGGFYDAATHSDALKACETDDKGQDAFGRDIGFCLPVGEPVTTVTFGGRNKFANIGEFIKFIYQYGMVVAGVLVVMVIVIAGVMYIFSGGNTDTVGQAKKRIYGAVIGLVLMALAYTMLNVVNPYLVNMKLPGIWAVNSDILVPYACNKLQSPQGNPIEIALAKQSSATRPDIAMTEADWFQFDNTDKTGKNNAKCGFDYFIQGKSEDQFCRGDYCDSDTLCFQGVNEANQNCKKDKMIGQIYATDLFSTNYGDADLPKKMLMFAINNFWSWKWITEIEVDIICNDGKTDLSYYQSHKTIDRFIDSDPDNKVNKNTKKEEYIINYTEQDIDDLISECDNDTGKTPTYIGFAINVDVNLPIKSTDENHLLGRDKEGNMIDLCAAKNVADGDNWEWCNYNLFILKPGIPHDLLITKEQLLQGFVFNINVSNIFINYPQEEKANDHYTDKWGGG